ncbi:LysR family transcriptional regulator [Roseburia faecis]|uniref:LysR family transcriptional regulator n=1 Tax=Roseburia faecis TaxID=301302 RepID=UPI002A8C17F8|nr:LysR family transcriptional regulator [Roseburia faecis]MDY4476846.1 LysR family transcriptional regulator [Roseburia faecis]MDY6312204.1 LysR family transcriptional regulator [Lachnospiraceae bacterium]MDY6353210.1 LysR family transcriptional regulator [Lachnospiraceae bacterium]
MLDLYELRQLVAFAELGTLSKVADQFHVSTPSITRSMQHLEENFGVPLFHRGKNKIELNETGKMAVEYGQKLLQNADQTVEAVRTFDQRRRTIVICSCAPAPVWELLRKLNAVYPDRTIQSTICQKEEVLTAWKQHTCDIAVLPFPVEGEKAEVFMREHLYVCVPRDHKLASEKTLTFADINGFNFLLRSELGFWDTLCREKMPASKFLVQTDEEVFDELVEASSLPCFTTDYGQLNMTGHPDRINIELTDPEADVTFYLMRQTMVL